MNECPQRDVCVSGFDLPSLCLPAEAFVLELRSVRIILPDLLPDKYLSQVSGTLTLASDSDTLTSASLRSALPRQREGRCMDGNTCGYCL